MSWVGIGSVALALCVNVACADEAPLPSTPERPAILFNRWQEDWSVLADPSVPREAFDDLKYIPLDLNDPARYLSFGGGLRERFEVNDAAEFWLGHNRADHYLISRFEVFADLRPTREVQIFTMIESAWATDKARLTPVDQDRAALELAFVTITEPLGEGVFKLRLGRQQFAFDLQRFVSVRDGPNVRQSYDAAWADVEQGAWRYIGFYSHPVENRDTAAFEDYSSEHLTYGGARVERELGAAGKLSFYYSRFTQDAAAFLTARGNEFRNIGDARFTGAISDFDWDCEAMGQAGEIGNQSIRAWAFGSMAGYTLADVSLKPRVGLQIDIASGDRNPHDHALNTFNPLFPNGYYLNLSGYTGYVNVIHVKPSVTLHPDPKVKVLLAAAAQWRETTADAVYAQPNIPVPGTAGRPGRYSGTYGQMRVDWAVTPHYSFALEAVHFAVGEAIRAAGGRDSDYLGVELKFGW